MRGAKTALRIWGLRGRRRSWNDLRWRADTEQGRFLALLFAGVMNQRGAIENAFFYEPEREPFQPWPPVLHAPLIQGPERPHHIRNSPAISPVSRRRRRMREERV